MKVNRLVVMLAIAVILIVGGIWLGVHLTQKNNQPVVAIMITKYSENEQKNADFLLLNQKNKIIFAEFNDINFENKKIVGENIDEFIGKFFENKNENQDKNYYTFEIFGEQHQNILDIKKQIKKLMLKSSIEEKNMLQIQILTNSQTTNLSQKYKKFGIKNEQSDKREKIDFLSKIYQKASKKWLN